jgi:hypothetical protein
MFPLLRSGWVLVLDHGAVDHPFGTVIVFLQGRVLVAHRVVGRLRTGSYLTKGDALLHFDRRPVRPRHVLGRVVALRRADGTVSLEGRRQIWFGRSVAAASRLVGDLHRASAPLRRFTTAAGRLPGALPGPTRMLRAVNRRLMGLAGRLSGRPQSPPKSAGDPDAGGSA